MSIPENFFCNLIINQFELPVFLGWPHDERQEKQKVSIDIHINYQSPPSACVTDKLEDTLCYSWLTDKIREKIADQSFRLIEHLAKIIHAITHDLVPNATMISVAVTKQPAIEGLKGGITFTCVSYN